MTDAAQKIAERVPLPEPFQAMMPDKMIDQLRAYGLAVAAEALRVSSASYPDSLRLSDHTLARMPLRGAEAPVNANVRRLAKVVVDTHLAMDRSGVIGRDGALHCEHCGAMRDSSDGGTDEPHRPNCVVLIAESILAAPPAGSVEVTDAMVGRAARALCEKPPTLIKFDQETETNRAFWRELARTALTAALQEP